MSKIEQKPTIAVECTLRLTESEMRALEAISGYSHQAVLNCLLQHLGKAYLGPYGDGLLSLLASVRELVPPILRRADEARATFNGTADIRLAADLLVKQAERQGKVLTIEQRPRLPLAMGNYDTVASVRPAREQAST
ncbi:hypothetical protein [Piscinibacter gummiphilus]|uniref:Uncharacterized protein n=1 Tax=Piscinibacter gummiphilus TaxID=946333 RepID=A0ABZ0CNK0_9BURK|nr:hypothetical protein [Piscinibacter gummiphilus]WOB06545.1 hypothetical protein RXV79_16620 [Piscinibacter gummiphilus]